MYSVGITRLVNFCLTFLLSNTVVSSFVIKPRHSLISHPNTLVHHKRSEATNLNLVPFHALHDATLSLSQQTIANSRNLFEIYANSLKTSPIITKSLTSGILATLGDAIAQILSSKDDVKDDEDSGFQYDIQRGICFLGFGALYTGTFQHFWFQYLGSNISEWGEFFKVWGPTRVSIPVNDVYSLKEWWMYFDVVATFENPPSDAALAVGKLAVNQFITVPVLYMPLFFAFTGALSKLNVEQSIDRARSMYLPLLKRNYFFWLPMQLIQFLVIPTEWQIPYISAASLLWTVILSNIASQQTAPQSTESSSCQKIDGDAVRLEDVENALIPADAQEAISNPKVGATVTGGFLYLLAAAADDGALAEVIAEAFDARISACITALTAVGAGVGFLSATNTKEDIKETVNDYMEQQDIIQTEASKESSEINLRRSSTMDTQHKEAHFKI
mmetsp:Transcript_21905/g.27097  ORF Transcript_21905/g.27097 Transcript_21905/m.27097 type:complete len:445 (+) Transcript_21905:83-1417(+)|eukprot:CAMPEP_0172515144 /NCGR_PEP_ID=MMETSP1066-20121228/265669_1 /TAXON_ID=671091 /ORGANISM="Coscinodiscus wailesii, Strain CCMP2513" /LENGTH=444 /DNA_ID=CAMNT_0013296109 /DNA_START=81 /DNA_END=1415 /DNA_ORIENTATION=+